MLLTTRSHRDDSAEVQQLVHSYGAGICCGHQRRSLLLHCRQQPVDALLRRRLFKNETMWNFVSQTNTCAQHTFDSHNTRSSASPTSEKKKLIIDALACRKRRSSSASAYLLKGCAAGAEEGAFAPDDGVTAAAAAAAAGVKRPGRIGLLGSASVEDGPAPPLAPAEGVLSRRNACVLCRMLESWLERRSVALPMPGVTPLARLLTTLPSCRAPAPEGKVKLRIKRWGKRRGN